MSHSEDTDGIGNQSRVAVAGLPRLDDDESVLAPGAGRLVTRDQAVDEALEKLERLADEPLDTQIEVSEQVHRVLQGRLADLEKR